MSKTISLSEVAEHNSENSCWMVIHNDVYDVTKFLNEHPGGADALVEFAGKNGTQAFEDVGHSDDAREMMIQYKIGTVPEKERDATWSPSISEDEISRKESKTKRTKRVTISDCPMIPKEEDLPGYECKPAPPPDGSWKKYALLALLAAVTIGIIIKMKSV